MELSGKTILLTGASSGIGLELARLISKENCRLAILGRRIDMLEDLAAELNQNGTSVKAIKCDVSNREEVKEVFHSVKSAFGKIDLAILNSGVSGFNPAESFNAAFAANIININVTGMMNCFERLLPDFINDRGGIIAGVSSLADGRGFPRSGVYCASKAAATTFLESMRAGLKKYNIKVITVKPGFVKTPMTAKNKFNMPFLMNADKAAEIILNGIRKEKRIISFPFGTTLGAKILRLLPNPLFDKIAARL